MPVENSTESLVYYINRNVLYTDRVQFNHNIKF
jgi:hypothetical protein